MYRRYWPFDSCMLDSGCWIFDVVSYILDIGYWILGVVFCIFANVYWGMAIRYRALDLG